MHSSDSAEIENGEKMNKPYEDPKSLVLHALNKKIVSDLKNDWITSVHLIVQIILYKCFFHSEQNVDGKFAMIHLSLILRYPLSRHEYVNLKSHILVLKLPSCSLLVPV